MTEINHDTELDEGFLEALEEHNLEYMFRTMLKNLDRYRDRVYAYDEDPVLELTNDLSMLSQAIDEFVLARKV